MHAGREGLRRSPTNTSTSSSLASLACTASSGWCSSLTWIPARVRRRRRAPATLPSPPPSPTATWRPRRLRGVSRSAARARTDGDQLGLVVAAPEARRARGGWRRPRCRRRGGPALRWNSPSARAVASPKMPSTRSVSKPRLHRRCCSSATSSPRSIGVRRYKKRSPSRKPASTRVFQVWGPQTPSTRRPRRRWKASTAARVAGPKSRRRRRGSRGRRSDGAGRRRPRDRGPR